MTLSIKGLFATFIKTTFIITSLIITTSSIMTLSITMLCYYAECRILYTIMLNVVMLSVVMLSLVMLSVVMLNVVMLSVVSPLILIIVSGLLICSKYMNDPIFSFTHKMKNKLKIIWKYLKKLLLFCSFFISVNEKKINIKTTF